MNHFLSLSIPLVMLFTASCAGGSEKQKELGTGQVIPAVLCASDRSVSYAVYIPAGCQEGERLPVYIAFDPHADGSLPVSRYRPLAEQHRFILMGSNDSRNGQPADQLQRIAGALVSEAQTRFHADSTRLFFMGFSGGARVSCLLGMYGFPVKGVIGCGAGLPSTGTPPAGSFDYFVIAGEAVPNLAEVISQDDALTEAGWRHRLMVIPGGHAWPPSAEMGKAIQWMKGTLQDMPPHALPYAEFYQIDKESAIQEDLVRHFEDGDTSWMRKKIGGLASMSEHPASRTDSLIARRLIAFLGLLSWSYSTGQMNAGQLDEAYRSLVIYRMVEPENPAVDSLFDVYYRKRSR